MVSLKETSINVLKNIYSDSRIDEKKYTELEALYEIENAVQWMIKRKIEQIKHENNLMMT